jgi:hypothetical protein
VRLGTVGWMTMRRFVGIVGWVGSVDWHSSPPRVGTQYRIRPTLGNGSRPHPVQADDGQPDPGLPSGGHAELPSGGQLDLLGVTAVPDGGARVAADLNHRPRALRGSAAAHTWACGTVAERGREHHCPPLSRFPNAEAPYRKDLGRKARYTRANLPRKLIFQDHWRVGTLLCGGRCRQRLKIRPTLTEGG